MHDDGGSCRFLMMPLDDAMARAPYHDYVETALIFDIGSSQCARIKVISDQLDMNGSSQLAR